MAKSNKIKFSISTLKKYLEDENSLVKCVKEKYHLAVKPWELGNLNESLQRIFNDEVGKFDKRWGGILLSTKNITMLSDLGDISNDSPDIHINVEADFYVFKPELDSILTGVVSKKNPQHLGVLVHQIFLVTIPKTNVDGPWKGNKRNIGDSVTFRINKLNLQDQLPYIRGQLEPSSSDEDDSGISTSEAECSVSKKKIKPNKSSPVKEVNIKKKPLGLNKTKKKKDVVDGVATSPTKRNIKKLKNPENVNESQDKKSKKTKPTNKSFDDGNNLTDQEVRDVSPKKERNSIISEFLANAQNLLNIEVKNNTKKLPKNKNLSKANESKKRKLNVSDENNLDASLGLKKAKKPKLDVSENGNNESLMASPNLKEKYRTNKSVKNNENLNKTPENKRKSLVKKTPSSGTKDKLNKLPVTEREIEVTPQLQKINRSANSLSERNSNSVGRKISESFGQETEESLNDVKKQKTIKSRRNTIIGIESEVKNTGKQKKKQNSNIKTPDQSIIKKKIKYIDNLPNNSIFLTPDLTSTAKKLKKKRSSDISSIQLAMINNIKAEKQDTL